MNSFDLKTQHREKTLTELPLLSLQHISKSFLNGSSRLVALEDINLEVKAGEFVCLVGPSGCGKSTILNLVAGLEKPDSGQVLVKGKPIGLPGPDRLFLFQEPALFPWLDVLSNIEFGLKAIGIPKAERRERAMKYLAMVHLEKFARFRVHQLSGGMRQRVVIARALAINPEVLLMDEPFTALDAQARDTLHQELQQLWAETGKTILFVTHNVREAVTLGTRVVVFTYRPARIKAEFSTAHIPRPRHIEDEGAIALVREITATLRHEVHLALAAEYGEDLVLTEESVS
jgi:NitT/TauT family transport system ATP-binding protein